MKRYILTVLIGLLAFAGCKKGKLTENELSNQRLQGKWQVTHMRYIILKNGKVVEGEDKADGMQIFEFIGDRLTLTQGNNSSQSYGYTLEGNEIVLRSDGNGVLFFRYNFNSDTLLLLSQSETVTRNNITYEDKVTYVMSKM